MFKEINTSFKPIQTISYVYKGYNIFINDLGYLWIKVSDKQWDYMSDNQKIALDILNEIISVANVYDIKGIIVKKDDLCYGSIDNDTNNMHSMMYTLDSSRHSMIYQIQNESRWYLHAHERDTQEISISNLETIINLAENISKNKRINTYLKLYLDTYTHYNFQEYVPTFLFGWIFIEKYVDEIWVSMLKNKSLIKNRYEKLTGIMWSADYILETLNLLNVISMSRYQTIMSIKRARNKLLHDEVNPSITVINSEIELLKEIMTDIIDEYLLNT